MAWLTASTPTVTNTFTIGDINIDLKESVYSSETGALTTETTTVGNSNYKFVPGDVLPKDPKVTVTAGSEKGYLFIKIKEVNNSIDNVQKVVNWTIDTNAETGWKAYQSANGAHYYYRIVDASKAQTDVSFDILNGNIVRISPDVTKEMVPVINGTDGVSAKEPKLVFEAAAVQYENIADVNAAWGTLPEAFKN